MRYFCIYEGRPRYFYVYEGPRISLLIIAGIGGLVVGHPGDTIKVRQQTYNSTLWRAVKETYRYEGVRGFFKGMLFPLLTTGPASSVFFGVYGNSLHWLQSSSKSKVRFDDPFWQQKVFFAGIYIDLEREIIR